MIPQKRKRNGKPRQYPEELKQRVLQTIIQEGIGASDAAIRFGISRESTVRNWINSYNKNLLTLPPESETTAELKELSKSELEQKVKELEKLLKYEKMKTEVLDTMIDIAEEELKISIRKKSDTKQSKN
jgi:transposase-like protein